MKVGIIGAGLFGTTAAIHAARAGHDVTLYDKASEIMAGATKANQLRLHRGYHYPRSASTVEECRQGLDTFAAEYGDAILSGGDQYYAIAKGSKTPVDDYIRFMDAQGLEWRLGDLYAPIFNADALEEVFSVTESRVDHHKLRSIISQRLSRCGVDVQLEQAADISMRSKFDHIVIAGYAGTNEIATALGCQAIELQYEIVEKPVVRLPKQYRDIGVVVMDGPFGCVDPAEPGTHLVGHVELAVHERWTGKQGKEVVDKATTFRAMATALSAYLPFMSEAEHIGSHRTVRVVLPRKDSTDERPTMVTRLDDQVMRIFAGKLGHAVDAAKDALALIDRERMAA
jgi:glycine/D-amino acid oxidase-like deaminating enzyme